MDNLELFGIALMPLIVAVVEFLKKTFGLPTDYAPVVSAILAVAGYWLISYVSQNPDMAASAEFWINALVIFLGASGFYGVVKHYGKKYV